MCSTFSMNLAGRDFIVEVGELAQLANGSVLVRYGGTTVLVAVCASKKPKEGIDFFPLTVDYQERLYAVGKIPGSFLKREGKPSEKAVLTSRMIDRPMRPLFPKDFRNDVSIVATVLSVEQDNSPEIAAVIGASMAVSISDIPFNGPIGAVSVGIVDDELIINPTSEQRQKSILQLTVAGTEEKIVMIEAGANEVPEDKMLEAIKFGHKTIKEICKFINSVVEKVGKPKFEYEHFNIDMEIYNDIKEYAFDKVKEALDNPDKKTRDNDVDLVLEEILEHFEEKYPEREKDIDEAYHYLQKQIVRQWILDENKRVDGRKLKEIRQLSAKVDILPMTHGSALFNRGQTQVLTIVTLGALGDIQILDGLDDKESKRYMHHYNFPPFSVGEARSPRAPGRREIGHGALAEKALRPVIPSEDKFPYAIRLVSEVLSSNGSTSQGSVCGSTLALMAAGVPISAPVAGISAGLVSSEDKTVIFTDIQGIEDFFGEMDFKVAGTKKGITAIQVDIKNNGLTYDIIKEAFNQTRNARVYILDEVMLKAISKPKSTLSKYAPKIFNTVVDVDKIRDIIGSGGKTIQKIIAETGVKVDIEDDGRVFVSTKDEAAGRKALKIIEGIAKDVEVGDVYLGKVVRITNFGAFVKFLPGKEGLIHISKLSHKHVAKVEDVVNIGDEVLVKVIEIDRQGRINLSRKDAMPQENNNI